MKISRPSDTDSNGNSLRGGSRNPRKTSFSEDNLGTWSDDDKIGN
jgi:hypothetical protein